MLYYNKRCTEDSLRLGVTLLLLLNQSSNQLIKSIIMLALCLLLSFGTIFITMLLYFESKDNKRLNSLLGDYRTRRYKDEQTLSKMEELITSHRFHYRETVKDYKSIISDMTSKIKNPVEKLKSQANAAKPALDLKDFSKKIDNEFNGLKTIMLDGPEEQITSK